MTTIKPLGDKVLIQPIEAEQTTSSGLIIPDTAQQVPQEAIVIELGTGKKDNNGNLVPFDVKVGDKVIYSLYGGTKVSYDGKSYIIMETIDLIAVVGK
jgi:chaperonin GroES